MLTGQQFYASAYVSFKSGWYEKYKHNPKKLKAATAADVADRLKRIGPEARRMGLDAEAYEGALPAWAVSFSASLKSMVRDPVNAAKSILWNGVRQGLATDTGRFWWHADP